MAANTKSPAAQTPRARISGKGRITIPVEIRRSMGVKPGDHVRFEPHEGGIRMVRDTGENVFEKWRGIGGFPGMGKGREAIIAYFRGMRGHVGLD